MQRTGWLVWLGILFVVGVMQPSAQTQQAQSLLTIIQERADLTTFSTFVSASYEDVPALLTSSGAYTVFAPNNTAFANLASLLGVPLGELLQKPEVISQLVRYHVLEGQTTSSRLTELDGSVLPTLLPNAFVAVRLQGDDVLTLNNVVSVVESDIRARNGILHIVDDVLLNRVIVETLNNPAAEDAITPNPTTAPPTPEPSPTPLIVGRTISAGYLRFANLVPGEEPLRIALPGVGELSVQPGALTDYVLVPTSANTLTVSATEVIPLTVTAEVFQTVAVLDAEGSLRLQTILEDYSDLAAGESRVTLFNGLPEGEGVSVFAGGVPLLASFVPGASAQLDFPAGAFEPVFTVAETSARPDDPLALPADGYTFIAVYGSSSAPMLAAQSLPGETVARLQADLQHTATDEPLPSLAQILNETPDFTFMAEAVGVLEESLRDRIAGTTGEPLTMLAPSDEAFADFLVTIDRSRVELLNDTALLRQIVRYHLLNGEVRAADFRAARGTSIVTLLSLDEAFFVTQSEDGELMLNQVVSFIQTDISASNGMLHIIDEVLLPRRVIEALGL